MYLIIDVGNTRVKTAIYQKDELVKLKIIDKRILVSEIKKLVKEYQIKYGIISSVAKLTAIKIEKLQSIVSLTILSYKTKTPFVNLYKTPKTLGVDRIALIANAVHQFPKKNVLVIDAGTCITYDFVTADAKYLGGAISMGVTMRYKALNQFTANLPIVKKEPPKSFIGNSTKSAINIGVVNGVCNEIDGIIHQYKKKFTDLTVVLTGGDTYFLLNQLKSSIFANPNFLLEGLHTILIYNLTND